MKPMTIDYRHHRIVLTRAFAKKASEPSSREYRDLKDAVSTFPTFKVVNHTILRKKGKETYKGLNFEFMEDYINTHVEESKREKAMDDLREQKYLSKCHSKKFPTIRKWFLETYPEIKSNYGRLASEFENRNTFEVNFSKDDAAAA